MSVASLEPLTAYGGPLEAIGYVHVPHPDDSFCPFFHRPSRWPHTHHVHVVEVRGAEERRTLAFRDYLRGHDDVAREYERLKRELARSLKGTDPRSRESYAQAKTEFVERVVAQAVGEGYPRALLQPFELVWPAAEYLPGYIEALKRGWSPDNLRPQTSQDELERIASDPDGFLAEQVDRETKGPPIALPDGSTVARLPGFKQWMWDGEFCGSIGFRWQPGTTALPPYCLGHIGYSVVPWKRQRGYATRALRLTLPLAKEEGLDYVELTADADNVASRRTIEANGGVLVERFYKPAAHGGAASLRFRITLIP